MINDTKKFMALCVGGNRNGPIKAFLWTYDTQAHIRSSFRTYPKVIGSETMTLTPEVALLQLPFLMPCLTHCLNLSSPITT